MGEWQQQVTPSGSRIQSGIPKRFSSGGSALRAGGLLLRGVVVATYVLDDPKHPFKGNNPKGAVVYCDVLCYSGTTATRWRFIPNVLVSQEIGGMHRGRVWKPRAATLEITGKPIDWNKEINPAQIDADHVLVGFLDDNFNLPVILRGIPHPGADIKNDTKDPGNRINLLVADGDPDFWKHHGSYFGVDDNGDFVVNTACANNGSLLPTGEENPPPVDGSGSQNHYLPQHAKYLLQLLDMSNPTAPVPVLEMQIQKTDLGLKVGVGAVNTLKVELADTMAKLTLGDGTKHVPIVETLQAFYTALKAKLDAFDAHTHTDGMGGTGVPSPTIVADPWDATINSSKVSIPNG